MKTELSAIRSLAPRLEFDAICYKTPTQSNPLSMMQELIARIVTKTGLDAARAEKALGVMLSLVRSQGHQQKVAELFSKLPGAAELADRYGREGSRGGGLLGMLGGGLGAPLAAMSKLHAVGLNMEQIKQLGTETMRFAKEKAGEDLVKQVIGSIPGLASYV
jgi:hypothetical protein